MADGRLDQSAVNTCPQQAQWKSFEDSSCPQSPIASVYGKGREEMASMSRRLEEVLSFIGTGERKRIRNDRPRFNGELLDRKREDVFSVMFAMGMNH